jgi:hypothetical protein
MSGKPCWRHRTFTIADMTASSTLPSLLWNIIGGLEHEYANQGAGMSLLPPLEMWANLLRAVNQAGIDRRELPATLRLSKRAVGTRVSTALRLRWVEELKLGPRQEIVRLAPRCSDIADRWNTVQRTAEERWQASVGIQSSGTLRACLEELVAAFPLEYPHYPAGYGPADASITGGNGADWKEVLRGEGDTVSHLPLSSLVSEALVAFAIGYEKMSPVALSLSTDVIQRIPAEGRPLREIGLSPGLSALRRHGYVRTDGNGGKIAYLTHRGLDVQRMYEGRIQLVEEGWCEAFGNSVVTALRRVLENVARPADAPQPTSAIPGS